MQGPSTLATHVLCLHVPGADIVEDCVAEDMRACLLAGNVGLGSLRDDRPFELVIHPVRFVRPNNFVSGPDHI